MPQSPTASKSDALKSDSGTSWKPGHWVSVASAVLSIIGIGLNIFGIALWLPAYFPNIHVDHRGSNDARDPFTASFSITNNGYFSVYDVKASCRVIEVDTTRGGKVTNRALDLPGKPTEELQRSDMLDIPCPFGALGLMTPEQSVTKADIDIAVSFSPRFYPKRLIKCVEFTATEDDHGNLDWMQKPAPPEKCETPMPVTDITPP
ncbi:MAG: hypothetical protein IVW54_13810 [Candidatus Binataceae bacterium]|nr:hypothetical protein [Candidatus Binataceae bacterium]